MNHIGVIRFQQAVQCETCVLQLVYSSEQISVSLNVTVPFKETITKQ